MQHLCFPTIVRTVNLEYIEQVRIQYKDKLGHTPKISETHVNMAF